MDCRESLLILILITFTFTLSSTSITNSKIHPIPFPSYNSFKIISDGRAQVTAKFPQPFRIERTNPVLIGKKFEVKCMLEDGLKIKSDKCTFESPKNELFYVHLDTDHVTKSNGDPVDGLKGIYEGNTCGLLIEKVDQDQVGQWKCLIDNPKLDTLNRYHVGLFHLLTPELPYVKEGIRLPNHIIPETYDVELVPHIEADDFTIDGKVQMKFNYKSNEDIYYHNRIFMHSKNIHIKVNSIKVKDITNKKDLTPVGVQFDIDRDFFIIDLKEVMNSKSNYKIEIQFVSYLSDSLTGFYRSSYKDPLDPNKYNYLAVTQFEALGARLAFPCLDEPNRKAKFTITLGRKPEMKAASNMPIEKKGQKRNDYPGYVLDTFQESVKMSTYLLAFLVSDFGYKTLPDDDHLNFGIYTEESKMNQIERALKDGKLTIQNFEKHFNVNYPLKKMDFGSVPDFEAGAMENWGLILFQESLLLYDESIHSAQDLENVDFVICHELGHQWFGNLVTMDWWTDIWLNEGFATYSQFIGMDYLNKEYDYKDRFINSALQPIMKEDSKKLTRQIHFEITNPSSEDIVNEIIYFKGASIIRMLEHSISTETFKKGIENYLKKYQYGNADQGLLWKELNDVASKNGILPPNDQTLTIEKMMLKWTLQPGYPVIQVVQVKDNGIVINQKRFIIQSQELKELEEDESFWTVPISITNIKNGFENTKPMDWLMDKNNKEIKFDNVKEQAYILNVQQTGFYRVNYDLDNWNKLISQMNTDHTKIHRINRAQMIDDAFNLALNDQLDYQIAFQLVEYLVHENDIIPLTSAITNLQDIGKLLQDTKSYDLYKKFIFKVLEPIYKNLGFYPKDNDSHTNNLKRLLVLEHLCLDGYGDCIDESMKLYDAWKSTPKAKNPVHPNIRKIAYQTMVQYGSEEHFNLFKSLLNLETSAAELEKIIGALSSSNTPKLMNQLLESAFIKNEFKDHWLELITLKISRNSFGRKLIFKFIKDNLDTINMDQIQFIISIILMHTKTEPDMKNIESFIIEHDLNKDNFINGFTNAKSNFQWIKKHFDVISKILENTNDNSKPNTGSSTFQMSSLITILSFSITVSFNYLVN